ncbi:MAG: translation initiation factor IF-3 [Saprospiraceae bacterium]|nr:translation initiation factor IF-3 [Saprospiraceae bacterium]MCI1266379.1 translation initiation factor IF-3 [Saprospiraceae bacterium]
MNIRKKPSYLDELRSQFRINDQIRNHSIRLVGDNFDEISTLVGKPVEAGIVDTQTAIKWAFDLGMDLVEITAKSDPPVCKITDFNKFLYLKRKKEKEIKAKTAKVVIKEIRFGPNTDDHDFEFKVKHGIKFLEEGAKIKAYVQFKGRAIVFKDRGELILLRFMKELEPYGSAEELPRLEGKRMYVILTAKKGTAKT